MRSDKKKKKKKEKRKKKSGKSDDGSLGERERIIKNIIICSSMTKLSKVNNA